jgi:N-acetylglutamate synthase-like GNAT family acetyltransferase
VATIRQATEHDVPAIARSVERAYEPFVARIGARPEPMDADHAAQVADDLIWVAEDADLPRRVIGVLVLVPGRDHLLVESVAVDPERQGEGIGRVLLSFAEDEAQRRGVRELRLSTHEEVKENLEFFSRLEWQETGRGVDRGFRRVFFRKRSAAS